MSTARQTSARWLCRSMTARTRSTVADYLAAGSRPKTASWKGGRGRRGPLGNWLLKEKAAITEGKLRADVPLLWPEIADLAASDGVVRPDGSPYRAGDLSRAWSELAKRGLVPKLTDPAAASSSRTTSVSPARGAPTTVPPGRGQGGAVDVGGVQPPTSSTPTAPASVPPASTGTEQAPPQPRRSATDMPRRRRFGDED